MGFSEFLLEKGLITEDQLCRAQSAQQEARIPLPRALLDLGLLTEVELLKAEAAYVGYPYTELSNYCIDSIAIFVVPVHIIERYRVLPIRRIGPLLVMATSDPLDVIAEDEVSACCGLKVEWVVATADQIERGIDQIKQEAKRHYL